MKGVYAQAIGAVVIFAAGAAAGHFMLPESFQAVFNKTDVQEKNSGYTYINPLLFCSDQSISNYTNKVPLEIEDRINSYLASEKSQGHLAEASVYYKDLNDGPWVLINGEMRTLPASLLKVPIALAIYKHAEHDSSFLEKKLTLMEASNTNKDQYFTPPHAIQPDVPYTIKELAEYMLQDSDNGALYLLGSALPENDFVDSYSDLGLDPPSEVVPGFTMNVRTYASFFRVLFNASYLNRDNSEQMLSILAHSTFTQGLESGVPKGTTVAHKFGEVDLENGDKRLHDCGIIYRPGDPYILCIMTRGSNFDQLVKVLSNVSLIVWEALETQR